LDSPAIFAFTSAGQCAVLTGAVQSSSQINSVKQTTTAEQATQPTAATASSDPIAASPYVKPPKAWLYDRDRVQKLMAIKPRIMNQDAIGAGLKNVGNTCYCNSVLQSLIYTEPLQVFLRSDHQPAQCSLKKANKFCLVCTMKELQTTLLDENYESIVPRNLVLNLKRMLRDIFSRMEPG
jgi:ubiquitin C-terminal hydrolase